MTNEQGPTIERDKSFEKVDIKINGPYGAGSFFLKLTSIDELQNKAYSDTINEVFKQYEIPVYQIAGSGLKFGYQEWSVEPKESNRASLENLLSEIHTKAEEHYKKLKTSS